MIKRNKILILICWSFRLKRVVELWCSMACLLTKHLCACVCVCVRTRLRALCALVLLLAAHSFAPAEFLHACGCAGDKPQLHELQPRRHSE